MSENDDINDAFADGRRVGAIEELKTLKDYLIKQQTVLAKVINEDNSIKLHTYEEGKFVQIEEILTLFIERRLLGLEGEVKKK